MKKKCLLALLLSFLLVLSACGTPSSNTPSSNTPSNSKDDNTNTATPSNSTPEVNIPSSGDSMVDDLFKSITAETAEEKGICGADLMWFYKDNVLVIKGTGEMTDYGHSKEYGCAPWYKYSDSELYQKINWVIIGEGITSIGNNAFYECMALSKVILPSTLEQIGRNAFYNCPLQEITIPSSVTFIQDEAFGACYLKTVSFAGNAPEGAESVISSIREKFTGAAAGWEGEGDPPAPAIIEYGTVYYSGTGFDELIEKYPGII